MLNVNFEAMDLRSEIENIVHEILMEGVTKEDAVKELLNLHSVSGCSFALKNYDIIKKQYDKRGEIMQDWIKKYKLPIVNACLDNEQ